MAVLDKAARCLSPVSGLESPVASLMLRRLEPRCRGLEPFWLRLSHASQDRCVCGAVAMIKRKETKGYRYVNEFDVGIQHPASE